MNEKELNEKSKFMSLVLRHKPETINLFLDEFGYCFVDELISKMNISLEELNIIVETNNKKRFEFSLDKNKIRACQGHSIDINLNLVAKQPPEMLFHGTSVNNLLSILTEGIKKQKRQFVHLSEYYETAVSVGKRHGKPAILIINTEIMFNDGLKFYLSNNGVWLTEYVHPKYIERYELK